MLLGLEIVRADFVSAEEALQLSLMRSSDEQLASSFESSVRKVASKPAMQQQQQTMLFPLACNGAGSRRAVSSGCWTLAGDVKANNKMRKTEQRAEGGDAVARVPEIVTAAAPPQSGVSDGRDRRWATGKAMALKADEKNPRDDGKEPEELDSDGP